MVVEEEGEIDVVVSEKDLEREQKKLDKLKAIDAQKKKLTGKGSTADERAESKEARDAVKKQSKEVKKIKDELKAIKEKNAEQDRTIKSALGTFSGGLNPKAVIADALSEFMASSRAIPIIGAIIAASAAVFKAIEKEFGDGGIFDLRVRVLDIVRSIVGLKHLVDIEAGEVFMAADTRSPFNTVSSNNTENRRDGHVRYNETSLGFV